MRFGVPEVIVPDAEEGHKNRNILLVRSRSEVDVRFVSAREEFFKVFKSDGESDAQTDRGPKRIASADPVPEFEHVVRINAEFFDFFAVG